MDEDEYMDFDPFLFIKNLPPLEQVRMRGRAPVSGVLQFVVHILQILIGAPVAFELESTPTARRDAAAEGRQPLVQRFSPSLSTHTLCHA